ncbi:MAG: outer membrane beta-barrel protein, partial [Burkholderiales bacterium]
HWYIGGGLGGFSEKDNSQLSGQDAKFTTFFGGGYRASPNISVEGEVLYWKQEFDTPATIVPGVLTTANARTDLNTSGVGALVKFYLPLDSVDLYAGGGLGLYTSTLNVRGAIGAGSADVDESDTNVGYQLVAGADVFVSRRISVGLEYRWIKIEANFEPFVAGNIDAGGQFLFATVRGRF